MSDSDEDLFGDSPAGDAPTVMKPSSSGAGGDSDDDNLFGSDTEGGASGGATAVGGRAALMVRDSDDEMDVEGAGESKGGEGATEADKLTAILGQNKAAAANEAGAGNIHKKARSQSRLYLPRKPIVPEGTEKLFAKLPKVLKIQTDAYDKDTYDADEEQAEFGGSNKINFISDVIRWRVKTDDASGKEVLDEQGRPVRESNARLQKMKNGTFRVVVGASVFTAPTEALAKSFIFATAQSVPPEGAEAALSEEERAEGVTINSAMNLRCVTDMDGAFRMNIQVAESNVVAAKLMQQKIRDMAKTDVRIAAANTREIVERPEVVAERLQRAEEARLRQLRKSRETGDKADDRNYRIGMSADYMTAAAADDEQPTMYDDTDLGAIKSSSRRSKRGGDKKRGRKAEAAAMPANDERSVESEEDEDDGGFLARSDDDEDEDDDSGDDDDDNDDAPTSKLSKKNNSKKAAAAAAAANDSDDSEMFPAADDAATADADADDAAPVKKRARMGVVDDSDSD